MLELADLPRDISQWRSNMRRPALTLPRTGSSVLRSDMLKVVECATRLDVFVKGRNDHSAVAYRQSAWAPANLLRAHLDFGIPHNASTLTTLSTLSLPKPVSRSTCFRSSAPHGTIWNCFALKPALSAFFANASCKFLFGSTRYSLVIFLASRYL